MLGELESQGANRVLFFLEPDLGLRAVLVIDDLTLGPGVGGIRTRSYPSPEAAALDAARLARAMTIKCALCGLDAGGAKMVVIDQPGLNRRSAFRWLGRRIQELGGIFRTAGDLGTSDEDLAEVALGTEYVHREDGSLAAAVADGLDFCLEAALAHREPKGGRWSVAVQGAGAIGSAVARRMVRRGMDVVVADVDVDRAQSLAQELGARVVSPEAVLDQSVDVLAPCAIGGVIDLEVAERLGVQLVVGAANNILRSAEAGEVLHRRGVLFVPDPIASAGAVIAGISKSVMGVRDPSTLIRALGETTREVLAESLRTDRPPGEVAEARAWRRIRAAEQQLP